MKSEKPWAKLWRKESARFRSLPLQARMLASYVLKFVDERGGLPMGHRDPVTAIAIAIGAAPCDRRWLRSAVQALMVHGYIDSTDGSLVVPNYPKYQDGKPTRDEHETDVRSTRDEREISVSPRNDVLAQNVLLENKKEREVEVEVEAREARTDIVVIEPEPGDPKALFPERVTTKGRPIVDASVVMTTFQKTWLKVTGRFENVSGRGQLTRDKAQAIAEMAMHQYPEDPKAALEISAHGFSVLHRRKPPDRAFDVWSAMKSIDEHFVTEEEASRA